MFFRSLTLMRFSAGVARSLARLDEVLTDRRLRECGPLEVTTRGFVPPLGGDGDAPLTHSVNGITLFAAACEEKMLPGSVIGAALTKKVEKIFREEGRKVGAKERKRLKEDLITEMLPRAFARRTQVRGYVDAKEGWLVIDTPSRRTAENVAGQVREALGSFAALPLVPESAPRILLTEWLTDVGTLPAGLALGEECELREPTAQGAISRCRRQDLTSEDVAEHVRQGKQVYQLGATFEDRMQFVLGEDLSIKKLKFLDVVAEELGSHHADAATQADATFVLMTVELSKLFAKFTEWFALPRPSDA